MRNGICVSFLFLSLIAYSHCLGGSRSGGVGTGGGFKASRYTTNNAKPAVYNGAPYAQPTSKDTSNKTLSKPPPTKRSAGLTAWGIIGIVLTVILLSVGSYYTFIFYPLLCKKERNYDMIELTNV